MQVFLKGLFLPHKVLQKKMLEEKALFASFFHQMCILSDAKFFSKRDPGVVKIE